MKKPVTHCIKKRPTNLLQATFLYFLGCCMVFMLSGENRVFSSILLHSQGTEQCNRDVQNNNVFFILASFLDIHTIITINLTRMISINIIVAID